MLVNTGHKIQHNQDVGILPTTKVAKSMIECHVLSNSVLIVRLASNPFNIVVIQVYAPTSACSVYEIEKIYSNLDTGYRQCESQHMIVVLDDLNAKDGRFPVHSDECSCQ